MRQIVWAPVYDWGSVQPAQEQSTASKPASDKKTKKAKKPKKQSKQRLKGGR